MVGGKLNSLSERRSSGNKSCFFAESDPSQSVEYFTEFLSSVVSFLGYGMILVM